VGESLREKGGEYGATTGRPRRCGWLDLVALKYALWADDVDTLVLTKLDVLDSQPEIRVAVAYQNGEQKPDGFPASFAGRDVQVQWKTFPGWQRPTTECRTFAELPEACRAYVAWICEATNRPLRMISVGGDRDQIIRFDPPFRPDQGA
jgi:adenylosuccinate synthase